GHGERRRMGELVVGADDEVLKRISRVEGPGVGALLVEPPGSAGGRAQSIRVRRSRPTVTVPIAGNGRIATETTGGGAVADLQRYIDQPAGRQAKALGDEIQVVVMDPDRREGMEQAKPGVYSHQPPLQHSHASERADSLARSKEKGMSGFNGKG